MRTKIIIIGSVEDTMGNNYAISNLTINGSYTNAGLFGYSYNAEYRNIRLVSPSITNTKTSGTINTGALVGHANMPGASGCLVINPTINSSGSVGVFAGIQTLGNFQYCYFIGNNSYRAVGSVGQNANKNLGHAYSLSLGTGVTTSTAAVFNYNNTNYYFGTITLADLPTQTGYLYYYIVNNEMLEGTTFDITTNTTVTLVVTAETEYFEQTGNNEYTIKHSAGWGIFCDRLENFDHNASGGYCFDGKTIKLATDIDITRTAGSTGYHDFTGTFDGQGHTINVTINGGIVSAKGSIGMSATNGSITLGWMKADDSIYASSYSGIVTLAKAFIDDDDNTYESGTVSALAIAGKTLRPHVSIVSGDANGDGQVTLADAVAVVNHILGKTQENFNASNADVDGNGSITITDAVRIVGMLQHE